MMSEKHQARLRQARVCGSCRSNLNYPVYRREHGAFPAWCRDFPLLNTREFPHNKCMERDQPKRKKSDFVFSCDITEPGL